MTSPTPRVIALLNQKGGVGKTTTTVNLGAALAESGARVLMIDLDPQAHMSLHLGIDPGTLESSVYDLLTDPAVTAESVRLTAQDRIDVIPAEVDLAAAEQELTSVAGRESILRQKLAPIRDQYDYILLDCPPSLGLLTLNGLTASGEVIVPMQAHFLALQGLSKLLETVQLVRQGLNTQLRVSGVVLCVHDGNTNLATEVVEDLRNFFTSSRRLAMPWSDAVIFEPPIRRNIKLAECPSFGQTIFQYEPSCPGATDYRRLAEHIRESLKTAPASAPQKPALAAPAPIEAPAPQTAGDTFSKPVEQTSSAADSAA